MNWKLIENIWDFFGGVIVPSMIFILETIAYWKGEDPDIYMLFIMALLFQKHQFINNTK